MNRTVKTPRGASAGRAQTVLLRISKPKRVHCPIIMLASSTWMKPCQSLPPESGVGEWLWIKWYRYPLSQIRKQKKRNTQVIGAIVEYTKNTTKKSMSCAETSACQNSGGSSRELNIFQVFLLSFAVNLGPKTYRRKKAMPRGYARTKSRPWKRNVNTKQIWIK